MQTKQILQCWDKSPENKRKIYIFIIAINLSPHHQSMYPVYISASTISTIILTRAVNLTLQVQLIKVDASRAVTHYFIYFIQ